MEAEVTSMASGESSSKQVHCVTCGMNERWTARMWECDVCLDFFLCENCHNESEVLPARPEVHNQDHHMSWSHDDIQSRCDGCQSFPIRNQRWKCKVCPDLDLCEACYGGLDATDMPLEHLKEHPMIAIEVIISDMRLRHQPNFTKPVDPQWLYNIDVNLQNYGFVWIKRKTMSKTLSGIDDAIIATRGNAIGDNSIAISKQKEQSTLSSGNLFIEQARQATQTHGMIDKKHKVFLSHAGTEKDFVEQLYRDLLRVHHFGIFFDKEDDSLPKGEPFPKRIFDAAKHCELAIVVISHEYFTRKWPMLELAAFVEAQKTRPELKILPIFYKLTVDEFKVQRHLFVECWNAMALVSKDEMDGWEEALKVISRINGLEYNKKMGEPMFRDRIVEAVSKRVKPELLWDDSHVQGKRRMQVFIKEMIQLLDIATGELQRASTLCIGLYGVGGSGKTTMCKVWRNEMMSHFLGNVHHLELGSVDVLQMRKKLLQCLCQLDTTLLQNVDEGQALNLMKVHIPMQRVCLLIDNVSHDPSSIEEARTLLNIPFREGSLIVVTSRSSSILDTLKIERRWTMRIPSLATEEAKALFSHHAGCDIYNLTGEQMTALESFVEQCNFLVPDSKSQEYHPLALKVLGSQAGPNAEEWQKIKIDFKCCENDPLFSILRSSFDSLSLKYQRIFLDLALAGSGNICLTIGGLKLQLQHLYGEDDEKFVLKVVKDLQAKSLIEICDGKCDLIHVHDLYREFARMEVENMGLKHGARCCFSRGRKRHRLLQEGRVRIYDHPILHITQDILSCAICSEAELFNIQDCAKLVNVDVSGMENLRMFGVSGGCPELTRVNLEGAINLRSFVWYCFEGKFYPNLTSMESLENLYLRNDKAQSLVTPHGCLDFSKNSNLEELTLSYVPLSLQSLGQAVPLKELQLENCQHLEKFKGLEALVHLEVVALFGCSSLTEFPSLAYFPSLEKFFLEGATKLKQIQGFTKLIALRKLSLTDGMELEELPGIEACTRLDFLHLGGTNISNCSWISAMKDLTRIVLNCTKIRSMPDCRDLYKLSKIFLDDCQALESIGDNTGLIPPTFPQSLKWFTASKCCLNVLPKFHHESPLHTLILRESFVEDISSVVCCKQLQYLNCAETQITSLPDLSSLTRLKNLDMHGCKLLTRMDKTKSLPTLENIWVHDCTSLLTLPDLRSSKRLTVIILYGCPLVDPNKVELLVHLALI